MIFTHKSITTLISKVLKLIFKSRVKIELLIVNLGAILYLLPVLIDNNYKGIRNWAKFYNINTLPL